MQRLLAFLLLALHAFAQSFYRLPSPMPNAKIHVCPVPSGGNPCPAPASIYQDPGFTIPVGPDGNVGFWAPSAQYVVQILAPYNLEFLISLGGGGTGAFAGIFNVGTLPNPPTTGNSTLATVKLHFPQQATRLAGSSVPL